MVRAGLRMNMSVGCVMYEEKSTSSMRTTTYYLYRYAYIYKQTDRQTDKDTDGQKGRQEDR